MTTKEEVEKLFSKYIVSIYGELMLSKTAAETVTRMERELLALIERKEREAYEKGERDGKGYGNSSRGWETTAP